MASIWGLLNCWNSGSLSKTATATRDVWCVWYELTTWDSYWKLKHVLIVDYISNAGWLYYTSHSVIFLENIYPSEIAVSFRFSKFILVELCTICRCFTFCFFFQDNSARCWIYHENHLVEIPVHTNFPEPTESTDVKLDT